MYTQDLATQGMAFIYSGFTFNHCDGQNGCGTLSPQCRAFLEQQECFYSCDPYTAYYADPATGGTTYKDIPICSTYCTDWYNACKNDCTCVDDWYNWLPGPDGIYTCEDTCQTFESVYGSAEVRMQTASAGLSAVALVRIVASSDHTNTHIVRNAHGTWLQLPTSTCRLLDLQNMCRTIWGPTYVPSDDMDSCMTMWFWGSNPNKQVALPSSGFSASLAGSALAVAVALTASLSA